MPGMSGFKWSALPREFSRFHVTPRKEGIMAKPGDLTNNRIALPLGLTRRQLLPLLGATAASAIILPRSLATAPPDASPKPPGLKARFVYVGTYTFPGTAPGGTHQSQAKGIYVFRMNPSSGGLNLLQIAEIPNLSYLALDPTLSHLYSVNEMTAGAVSAYAINQANGMLTPLNTLVPTNGQDTTHLSVQPSGHYLFAASYTSGNFQVFPILADGSIGTMTDNFQSVGNGTGPNPARQEGPHAHQILTDLDGDHVFGVDLGADKVNVWNLDSGAGVFSPNTVPFAPVASGSGPRHMAFHPDRQHAMSSTSWPRPSQFSTMSWCALRSSGS